MGDLQSPKAKLWLEGILCFRRSWRSWSKIALGLVIVSCFTNVLTLPYAAKISEATKQGGSLGVEGWLPMLPLSIIAMIITLIAAYFFSLVFLKQKPINNVPQPNWKELLYFVGQGLQISLIVLLPGCAAMFFLISGKSPVFGLVLMFLTPVWASYLGIKFSLALPMAVSRIKAPLDSSWALTNGNWWRLFWSYALIVAPIVIMKMIFKHIFPEMLMPDFAVTPLGSILLVGYIIISALLLGLTMALSCTACRILVEEKRQSAPSFVLGIKP